jgi:hypothetical protein
MDELKLLIEMVANLPTMAVWVLVGFFVYKVVVIGSIYGVIRLGIVKTHSWLTHPKTTTYKMGALAINETVALALAAQLNRLSGTGYIHASDVAKLADAIDHIEAQKRSAK